MLHWARGVLRQRFSWLASSEFTANNYTHTANNKYSANFRRDLPDLFENPTVVAIAQRLGKTPAQVLLKWVLQQGVVAIPKSTNADRLRQNLDVYGFVLSAEDIVELRGLDAGIRVCDFEFIKG